MQIEQETIANVAKQIETEDEFVRFLHLLADDQRHHVDDWENDTLDRFLEAMSGYAQDTLKERASDTQQPSWAFFAHLLLAARVYE